MREARCYRCGWRKVLSADFEWDARMYALACPKCSERVSRPCLDCGIQVLNPYNRCDTCTDVLMRNGLEELFPSGQPNALLLTFADRAFLKEMAISAD